MQFYLDKIDDSRRRSYKIYLQKGIQLKRPSPSPTPQKQRITELKKSTKNELTNSVNMSAELLPKQKIRESTKKSWKSVYRKGSKLPTIYQNPIVKPVHTVENRTRQAETSRNRAWEIGQR